MKTGGQAFSRSCLLGNQKQLELEIRGTGSKTPAAQRVLPVGAISVSKIMPFL